MCVAGVLCGRCRPNYGMTAPFKCNLCLGAQPTSSPDGDPTQQQRPWPGPISALYLVYWFVLTCWLLLCVRFSKPAPARPRNSLQPGTVPKPVAKEWQGTGRQAIEGDVRSSRDQRPLQSHEEKFIRDMPGHVQGARGNSNTTRGWQRASTARGSEKNTSRSIDITKVRCADAGTMHHACTRHCSRARCCASSDLWPGAGCAGMFLVYT